MASALALSPTLLPFSRHRRSILSPAPQNPLLSSIPRPHLLGGGVVSLPLVPSGRVLWRVRAETPKQEREPMVPPFNVLITGSTKGIGLAFAKEFLKAGDNVVVCSRSAERVELTIKQLREEFGEKHVELSVMLVKERMSRLSLPLHGISSITLIYGSTMLDLMHTATNHWLKLLTMILFVTTNTIGVMICCREAINMMLNQPRGGHIFNIDGAGSDGRPTPRFAAYGATKQSVVHLTKSLQAELQMQDVKNVMVHNLSPGMVTTDLLMSGANTKQAKFFINILAEPPDVVAENLVPSIRSVPSRQSMRPTYIRFLTGLKAYSQIFSRLAFGARRNRYVIED
ncbi:Short-chain dehydrogenase/reductase SDR protein [Dioscorea alata]|uniref:Short-chain dehydrogenase/reductase SDR protein n=1 Tax=Dioscorea alata TaxID=55571 RepID=A0ACB7WNG9_DIOAL|nr:Short-chain dehydrogenase/reductase SDR protein [Dioscorea alata]